MNGVKKTVAASLSLVIFDSGLSIRTRILDSLNNYISYTWRADVLLACNWQPGEKHSQFNNFFVMY